VIRRAEKVDYIPEKVAIIYSHLAHFVQVYKGRRKRENSEPHPIF
jgi:hypothetical protein